MLIEKENITRFIPQRAPFVMIDSLASADEKGFESAFTIEDDNIFLENDVLSESAVVENIAQTCAAGFGYVNSLKGEGEGQLGFIGAVSRLTVESLPENGATIETKIEILNTFDAIHLVQGSAYVGDQKLLECQMKIVIA
ncbi:MAG: hypothetical protein QNK23_12930 [Crocinitomicaceae bacterium]|nr:hypothetical protein [Crocinitomicaceae bacterium]